MVRIIQRFRQPLIPQQQLQKQFTINLVAQLTDSQKTQIGAMSIEQQRQWFSLQYQRYLQHSNI